MDANREDYPENESHHELEDVGDRLRDTQSGDRVSAAFDPAPVDLHAPVRRPTVYHRKVVW